MADLYLKDYVAKIRDLYRAGRHGESLAYGQHVLGYYPGHAPTNSLVGLAYLEQGMVEQANECFQLALGVDPENVEARIGLGRLYAQQAALPAAIQQVEWAYEVAPSQPEVREELLGLYGRRTPSTGTQLKMTRGAVGNLLARNNLPDKAIAIFRELLGRNPEIPHIQVALAETLWRQGRDVEAVEVCLVLTHTLPNCLKANLILGAVWTGSGHEVAGQDRLDIAHSHDPENQMAQRMMGSESPLPPENVYVPELQIDGEFGATQTLDGEELPDWLAALDADEPALPSPEDGPPIEEVPLLPVLPDWLRELEEDDAPATEAIEIDEVPEWLQELVRATGDSTQTGEADGSEGGDEGAPQWPAEAAGIQGQTGEVAGRAAGDEGVPQWLATLAPADVLVEAPVRDSEGAFDDDPLLQVPEWVRELERAAEGGAEDDRLPAKDTPVADTPAAVEWEPPFPGAGEPDASAEAEGSDAEDEMLPGWVQELEAQVGAGAASLGAVAGPREDRTPPSSREALLARIEVEPRNPQARLALARLHREELEWNAALDQYEKMVSDRLAVPEVIGELHGLRDEDVDRPRLYSLLGDAYRQEARLDEALDAYRQAQLASE
jgi:tetratricopeptide (TPR) repeat protein